MSNGFEAREGRNDGQREAIRQLERRMEDAERDRRELWRAQGAADKVFERLDQKVDNLIEALGNTKQQLQWMSRAMWGVVTGLLLVFAGSLANLLHAAPK